MKIAVLSGSRIKDLSEALQVLSRDLAFPSWSGNNLDALFDLLTTEVRGPVAIRWEDTEQSRRRLGKDYQRLVEVLEAASRERPDLWVKFVPSLPSG